MSGTLWLILAFVAAVIVYTIARILKLNRQSQQQWQQVDKSKLIKWEDEEDD